MNKQQSSKIMTRRLALATAVLLGVWSVQPALRAADTVRTVKSALSGKITALSADEITIRRTNNQDEKVPINEVVSFQFEGEPIKLNLARAAVATSRGQEALNMLDEIEKEPISRAEIKDEIAYLRAAASARMALTGQGEPREAGKSLRDYLQKNPGTPHFYSATQLLGDLFAKVGAYDSALAEYAKLSARPWPDYQMRGGIASAAVYRLQSKFDDALNAYDAVITAAESAKQDKAVQTQRIDALLGKAQCLAEMGRPDDGVKLVEEVIGSADAEDAPLHARAYNALGDCQRKANRNKEALLAYLHVDVLYPTQAQAHAEALRNLVNLWNAAGQPQRAEQAQRTLDQKYSKAK